MVGYFLFILSNKYARHAYYVFRLHNYIYIQAFFYSFVCIYENNLVLLRTKIALQRSNKTLHIP